MAVIPEKGGTYKNGRISKVAEKMEVFQYILTLLHSEQPKLYGVLAVLSAIGLKWKFYWKTN